MKSGPDRVIVCPSCGGLARHQTMLSGNTFGARYWTDGRRVAPMLLDPPPLVRCHQCGRFYWIWLAEERHEWRWQPGQAPDGIPEVEEPSEDDYYEAIEQGLVRTRDEEVAIRRLAWWRRNDAFRGGSVDPGATSAEPEAWRRNLEALNALLPEDTDDNRLLKGEVLRHLGEFQKAVAVLTGVEASQYVSVIQQMVELCMRGDRYVREVPQD